VSSSLDRMGTQVKNLRPKDAALRKQSIEVHKSCVLRTYKFEARNPKLEMVRPAVRHAHGHEQRRMAHHPEPSRRTMSNDLNRNEQKCFTRNPFGSPYTGESSSCFFHWDIRDSNFVIRISAFANLLLKYWA
jgi:hypothetical protein